VNTALHSAMKVGIVQFMAYPEAQRPDGPVYDTVAKIAEDAFFGAIEITTIPNAQERARVARLLAGAHMAIGFGAQPIQLAGKLDVNSLDREQRQKAIERLKVAIDEAYELGAQRFALLSGPFPGEAQQAEATRLLIDSLNQLCSYAESKGSIGVVIETFDRTIDKKSLIGPNELAVEVSKAVRRDHPTFGLMLDLSHLPLQFETSARALTVAKDHLVHAHIGNAVMKDRSHPLYGDLHPRFGVAGGENDVAELVEYLRVLREIGYIGDGKQNIVAFEVRPHQEDTSAVVVANAKRTLIEAWARL
jgi:sugar phosphate isomerase/epimerase